MTTAFCELIVSERVHTGEAFILVCAKAFIPCYPLHSEPLDTPLPEVIKADTASLQDGLDKANTELHELEEMSLEQAQQKLDEEIFFSTSSVMLGERKRNGRMHSTIKF